MQNMTKSSHQHWSHYDEALEMASFDALHAKLTAGSPDTAAEEAELARLADSAGYGEADTFCSSAAGLEPKPGETAYHKVLREQFESYMDGDYWNCIDGSENLISAISPEARVIGKRVCQSMRDAFEAGRQRRLDMEQAPAPAL